MSTLLSEGVLVLWQLPIFTKRREPQLGAHNYYLEIFGVVYSVLDGTSMKFCQTSNTPLQIKNLNEFLKILFKLFLSIFFNFSPSSFLELFIDI